MATVAERMLRIFRGYERAHYFADFTNAKLIGTKLVPDYGAVAGPITLQEIESHLAGRRAVLAVPVDEKGLSYFGKIDIDDYAVDVPALARRVKRRGFPLIVERSKSGGAHIAFYPKKPWESRRLRQQLVEWAAELGFANVEIFPKQDRLDPARDTGAGINLPYFGGDTAKNYAFNAEGAKLSLAEWLDAVESMPERIKPPTGTANIESAADFLAQFWTEGRRDILNIRVIGALLRAKIDEAAVERLVEKTRDIAGDLAEARRSVGQIATDLATDAKKVPGFTKLTDPADALMSREEALELMRLMGARPPPNPVPFEFTPITADWIDVAPPALQHVVKPLVPKRTVSLLVAEGGAGKTTFALRLAIAVATGRDFFGMETTTGRVVYVALEDQVDSLRRRVHWIVNRELEKARLDGMAMETIDGVKRLLQSNFIIVGGAGFELHLITEIQRQVIQAPAVAGLIEQLPRPLELLVLDPLARLNGAEENSNAVGTGLINAGERIARECECTVLIPHHTGKAAAREGDISQYSARGASALADAARSTIRLIAVEENEVREWDNCPLEVVQRGDLVKVLHVKCNDGPKANPFFLRRQALDFELFAPSLRTAMGAREEWVNGLWRWFRGRGAVPFYAADVTTPDAIRAIWPGLRLSRHQVREALTASQAAGHLIPVPPPPGTRGRGTPGLRFRDGFLPPEEEL